MSLSSASRASRLPFGLAQLSLVETALSPLDFEPGTPLVHRAEFLYGEGRGRRRVGQVTVRAASGLSPLDELVLYGLLATAFSGPAAPAGLELTATPFFLCRRLGFPTGGADYRRLRDSLHRLRDVTYHNTAWYDPARQQHRDVGFHFLSHDLPTAETAAQEEAQAREPWILYWDPLFHSFMSQPRGFLRFDFETYRALKHPAARRGFLLLSKIFHHCDLSPAFDLRSFAASQLGYAPTLEIKSVRQKLAPIIRAWQECGLIASGDLGACYTKGGPGRWTIRFHRGPRARGEPAGPTAPVVADHPATDLLADLGFSPAEIAALAAETADRPGALGRTALLTRAAIRSGRIATTPKDFFLHHLQQGRALPAWYLAELEHPERAASPERRARFEAWLADPAHAHVVRETVAAWSAALRAECPNARPDELRHQAETLARRMLLAEFCPEPSPIPPLGSSS